MTARTTRTAWHNVAMLATAGTLALGANATPSVTIDSVAQRWPWNNKIDITYTVSGGQDVALGVYARIVFTASIGATNIVIDGVHDVGANASDGTHTVAYMLPPGLKASGCTMTAQLLSADNPSGDDYMVVDLDTGAVSYEGLLASQDDSNGRYTNNVAYKTNKLVLRKVPIWAARSHLPNAEALSSLAGYPTGMDDNLDGASSSAVYKNSRVYWKTARDYYIGVFPVTQAQYYKICGSNPSRVKIDDAPVYGVTWNNLRISATAPADSIPAVSSFTGTFFQRLNYRTGLYFDLPTELAWEIAARAGATTKYPWGESSGDNKYYVVGCTVNLMLTDPLAVGTKLPNDWGIYDMIGNILEWCLDDNSRTEISGVDDPFAPASTSGDRRSLRGGNAYDEYVNNEKFRPSRRTAGLPDQDQWYKNGFRVAFIVP